MTIQVTIEITRDFDVSADFEATFALLSDVPKSASHFPKVNKLIDMGNNTYRWEMERLRVDKHAIQTIYMRIMSPTKRPGRSHGIGWKTWAMGWWMATGVITPAGARTHLRFCTQGVPTAIAWLPETGGELMVKTQSLTHWWTGTSQIFSVPLRIFSCINLLTGNPCRSLEPSL